jgi:predicted NUDIX family NTP pyrophosphohydrolase
VAGEGAIALGAIVQMGGKTVHAWAIEGDLDEALAHSNSFDLEWPPRSGLWAPFPEVDRVAWFDIPEAKRRIREAQVPLLDRLESVIDR